EVAVLPMIDNTYYGAHNARMAALVDAQSPKLRHGLVLLHIGDAVLEVIRPLHLLQFQFVARARQLFRHSTQYGVAASVFTDQRAETGVGCAVCSKSRRATQD